MRALASLLLCALAAEALPPLSPGFVRLRDLGRSIDSRVAELREQEAFAKRPREERMLLTFRKRESFEGQELTAKTVVETCLGWGDVEQAQATEAGRRVLALLPLVLRERCGGPGGKKERRTFSRVLLKALESDFLPVREAAIASLRAIYPPPREDKYDPSMDRRERVAPVRAWKRQVADENR